MLSPGFAYKQNNQPRLGRANNKFTISEATVTYLSYSTYVIKGIITQCIDIFTKPFKPNRVNFKRKLSALDSEQPFHWCAGIAPLSSPLICPSVAPSRGVLEADVWCAPGNAAGLLVNLSSSCPTCESLSPSASSPSEACSEVLWTPCYPLSGILCCSG